MILLKKIQLKNFLSHSATTLDFSENEHLLISGKSGAGKSSITESLVWCLYNTGRVQNRSLIKRGKNNTEVSVELTDGEDTYKIVRSLSIPKKNANVVHEIKIYKNNQPVTVSGARGSQEYIEKSLLRCSYPLLVNSVVYLQENLESFARQTPSARKDILLELVHADDYDAYYEKARQTINSLDTKLTINLTKKEALIAENTRNRALLEQLPKLIEDVEAVKAELHSLEDHLLGIQKHEIELNNLKAEIAGLDSRILDIAQNILKIQQLKKESEKLIKELQSINPEEVKIKFQEAQNLRQELTVQEKLAEQRRIWQAKYAELANKRPYVKDYSALISETEKEFQQVVSSSTEVPEKCPNCGKEHACTHQKTETERQTKRLAELLAGYEEKQKSELALLAKHDAELQALKSQEVVMDEYKIGVIKLQLSKLEPYIEKFYSAQNRDAMLLQHQQLTIQYDKTLEQYGKDKVEAQILKEKKSSELYPFKDLKEQKTRLLGLQQDAQIKHGQLSESLTLARAAQARKETIEKELEQFATEDKEWRIRLENLNLLKEALGQNGIRTLVLDYAIPALENRINEVLSKLSNFSVKIDTQRTNVTGESQIEGLFISIVNDNGEEFDYDSYSGGQKIKILFAISEGLATMQKLGFRVLDEAVIGLDSETGQQFAEAIMAFQSHYQQLICISHVQEIKDLFENRVTVVNINGDSKIYETSA